MELTQRDLDRMVCSEPGCTNEHEALVLRSRCHPRHATFAWYDKGTGILTIRCARCEQAVVSIAVAAGMPRSALPGLPSAKR